ncbi:MAG: amino acid permease [Lactobacillales bacterium]|jgi:D-serine/D-alanine/glycine transporter|nr:amino acid permease [Lactobacillales bacterium]
MEEGNQQELKRGLKNRHVQLISLGGAIGTGLFLGSGKTIQLAGPSILFAYLITGVICFFIMRALGELLLSNLKHGSFLDFIKDYFGDKHAFIFGWTYWFCWISLAMTDLTATGIYIRHWFPNVPHWLPPLITLIILLGLNLTAVQIFGELEFWFALIKVIAILSLIGFGIFMLVTRFKIHGNVASISNLWEHGGFFPKSFKGFFLSFQLVTFSFVGIEVVGLISGETKDPRKVIPTAINSIPFRIILFYVLALMIIMTVYPWNNVNAEKSPFVEVFSDFGILMAASIINFVVLTAAASACNSCIYSTSRMTYSLAEKGIASKRHAKLNKKQVPCYSIFFSSAVICVIVLVNYLIPSHVFEIVSSISTICFIYIWFMLVWAHMRYRKQVSNKSKLEFKMPLYPVSSYLVYFFIIFVVIVMFFIPETRVALCFTPLWFVGLLIVYWWKFIRSK